MRMVDYVVDGGDGEEEIFPTKREAIRAAQKLAKEQGQPIAIFRWFRPTRDDDMELDEWFRLTINEKGEQE